MSSSNSYMAVISLEELIVFHFYFFFFYHFMMQWRTLYALQFGKIIYYLFVNSMSQRNDSASLLNSHMLVKQIHYSKHKAITCTWKVMLGIFRLSAFCYNFMRGEKGRYLTYFYDKNLYTTLEKKTWQHKNANKNFDYTTITDRLRTASWINNNHQTGVVTPINGYLTFPLTTKAV